MPPGLYLLYDGGSIDGTASCRKEMVDIVAIPDVYEDSLEAWVDPVSRVNWLRDLLPQHIRIARVLTYGYHASASSFFANDAQERIQRLAESLVQELRANRQFAGTLRRPIIFICHGLGGVLLKRSLIYSSTRTAAKVVHLWDQYISTFAILFFGTPHGKTARSHWFALERLQSGKAQQMLDQFRASGQTAVDVEDALIEGPQFVDHDFAPLMKQFYMFFFWEQVPTSLGEHSDFIVDHLSAAPKIDNTESAGIHATHSGMVKFGSRDSPGYRTVLAALANYSEKAPETISHRWTQAEASLQRLRAGEAWELGGYAFDVHSKQPFRHQAIQVHRHFYPPVDASSHYIGREGLLKTMFQIFFPGGHPDPRQTRKSFVVHGMGGSGKTHCCSKFAHEYREWYTAVFTIHAATPETIADSLGRIGKLAGLEHTEDAGKHFLAQLTEPWLLIIDNADNPSTDLRGLYPAGDVAHILITTRNRDFRQEGTLGHLELRGLKEEEALRLLLIKADIPSPWDEKTQEAGNTITKALGYLALAVIQAGNCIYRRVCTLAEYLNLHSAARMALRQRRKSIDTEDEDHEIISVVYSSFDISLEFLSKNQIVRNQDASDLLKIFCFCHFERIPLEMFSRAITNRQAALRSSSNPSFASSLLSILVSRLEPPQMLPRFLKGDHGTLDKYRINWAISVLQSLSLISSDGRYISLHPLVHTWIRDRLSLSERSVWASVALHTILESISLPPIGNSELDGEYHRDVLPHLDHCLQEHGNPISSSLSSKGTAQLRLARFCGPSLLLIARRQVTNAAKCGWVYGERGLFEKASMHLRVVKDLLAKMLGEEHERTESAMLGLAGVYFGLGRLEESITLQRTVADARARRLGPMNEGTLQAMDQLGRSYWLHGLHREALELQQETVERMQSSIGEQHPLYPSTLAALDNLGVTLGAWHRFEESLQVHRQVLAARRKLLGDKHLDTLSTKSSLAMALLDNGHLDEAMSHITEVYEQRQVQLGKEHPWTLWALCYLAKVYIEAGRLEEAEKMLLWGIDAGIRSLNETHFGVILGRGELARVYARQGRQPEAEALTMKLLAQIEATLGPSHPDCIFGMWKLAQLHILGGNLQGAIDTCKLGLDRAELRITKEHPLAKKLAEMLRILSDPASTTSDIAKLSPATKVLPHGRPVDRPAAKRMDDLRGIVHSVTW